MNTPSMIAAKLIEQETLIRDMHPVVATALTAEKYRLLRIDFPEYADDYILAGAAHQEAVRAYVEKSK